MVAESVFQTNVVFHRFSDTTAAPLIRLRPFDNLAVLRLGQIQSPPAVYPPGFSFNRGLMKKLHVFVDGLNLHHSLLKQDPNNLDLNVPGLSNFLAKSDEPLDVTTHYFTSAVTHLGAKTRETQNAYLSQLRQAGAILHFGEFKSISNRCPICNEKYWINKEKQTDVALASEMVMRVLIEQLDEVYLFSADTDYLPALARIRELKPHVAIKVVTTVSSLRPVHGALARLGVRTIRLSPELVSKFQFAS